MGLVSLTTITNGTLADATTVMANYNAIATQVNGHLDGSNLDPALLALLGVSDPTNIRSGSAIIPGADTRAGAFGLMATPDRVSGIVLPAGGLIEIAYQATIRESLGGDSRAAIFLGANQLKIPTAAAASPQFQAAWLATVGANTDVPLSTFPLGLIAGSGGPYTGDVTTGQPIGLNAGTYQAGAPFTAAGVGGKCCIVAAPGNYDVSVQYSTVSGTVQAKNRHLYVKAIGF